jgi:hypothetical protein
VLDKQAVFKNSNLNSTVSVSHNHGAFNGLSTSEELAFSDISAATGVITPIAAALTLGIHSRRAGGGILGISLLARCTLLRSRLLFSWLVSNRLFARSSRRTLDLFVYCKLSGTWIYLWGW